MKLKFITLVVLALFGGLQAMAQSIAITNNPLTKAGTVGAPFNFDITATGSPTSFGATGLPPGVTLHAPSGMIMGTPTAAGTYTVALTATNGTATASATLTITIAEAAGYPPVIPEYSLTTTGVVGVPFTYRFQVGNAPTSFTVINLPPGLVFDTSTGVISGTPTQANTTFVNMTARNDYGRGEAVLMIVIAPAGTTPPTAAPVITSAGTASGTVGTALAAYTIAASNQPTSYGATGLPPGLTVNTSTGTITGTPTTAGTFTATLSATNGFGTTTASLTMTIAAAPAPAPSSRIVNFSARAVSGPGNQALIMGFVVAGDGKNLLVRGVGPGLTAYGLTNALADPLLSLYGSAGVLATNDDWQTPTGAGQADGATIAAAALRLGAFTLANGSKDASLLFKVNSGAHTTSLARPNGTTGVALTEIYDVDGSATSRLVNVSARMNVTTGDGALIIGVVIAGDAPKTLLIRGVGPTLTAYGVTGVLADPTIAVFNGSTQVAANDNWETGTTTAAQISAASTAVGAFALQAGAKDAALLLTLQPGSYTVQVSGVGATSGVALVEVYDVP